MTSIRIIQPPTGEAPIDVRAAWVGLVLPLAKVRQDPARPRPGFGVLSGSRGWWRQIIACIRGQTEPTKGYVVDVQVAVDSLAHHAPDAARWWQEHAPHLLRPGQLFVFDQAACEEVP